MNGPCKDCRDRKLLCHGSCKKYQDFKAKLERLREAQQRERDGYYPLPPETRYQLNRQSRNRRNRGL